MASLKIALQVDSANPNIGDLYLEHGSMRLTNTLSEEVAQQLFIRFRFFKGEWFLDPTQGVPWFQSILGIKTPIGIIQQIFRQVITTCPGVASLDVFNLKNLGSRQWQLIFTCTLTDATQLVSTDYGPFIIGAS